MITWLRDCFEASEHRVCALIGLSRSSYRYESRRQDDTALELRLRDLAAARPSYGYQRLHVLLRREGWLINHKRVYRLYKALGLEIHTKKRRKRVSALRLFQPKPTTPNVCWSLDFMHDRLFDGRSIRLLTIVDHYSRVSPAIKVAKSLRGPDIVEVLFGLKARRGLPQVICVDNGSEFTGKLFDQWAYDNGVKLCFSRRGKPTDNAMIESFNARLRIECLNQSWFTSVEDARNQVEAWRQDYNTYRPHSALGQATPSAFEAAFYRTAEAAKAG